MAEEDKTTTTITLSAELYARLANAAERERRSRHQMMQILIERGLDDYEREAAAR